MPDRSGCNPFLLIMWPLWGSHSWFLCSSQTSSGKNRDVFSSHQWMQESEILAHFYSSLLLGLCETFQLGIWLHLLLGSRNSQFVRNSVSEHVLMGNFSQVLGTLSFWGCNGSLAADGIFSKCWREAWPEAGRESGHSFGNGFFLVKFS